MQAPKIYIKVLYNGINITADISRNLLALTYSDHMDEADTLDLQLEDVDQLWQNEWYPQKGATIVAEAGILGGAAVPFGTFEIDEIETTGPPSVMNIRCIAAGFRNGKKRTKKSHTHENKTLAEIVKTVGSAAGFTVQGQISDIRIDRLVQRKQRDMRFLRRLARDYGYTFNIRDKVITFIPKKQLESATPSVSFDEGDLILYNIKDKSTGTYAAASVKFHNPDTGEDIAHTETEGGAEDTDDVLELEEKVDNKAQAIELTKAALSAANKLQQSGSITLPGSPLLLAGNVIQLTGLGMFSGNYIVKTSAHTISLPDGWIADCEIYKVGFVEESKRKKKKKEKGYSGPAGAGDKGLFGY